jgi:hypothetical protein
MINKSKKFTTYVTDPKLVKLWNDFEKEYGAEYIPTQEESNVLCEHLDMLDDVDKMNIKVYDDHLKITHEIKGKPYE